MSEEQSKRLAVGKITGAHGIRGWVKVYSYTDPVENILDYSPWQIFTQGQWREVKVLEGRVQGKGVVARLEGVNDRNAAELLQQVPIEVARDAFPDADEDEFYWDDLEGLSVVNREGVVLGTVSHLFETDAHPILVVVDGETERMIPYVDHYIDDVDLDAKKVIVDWQLDW